MRQLEIRFARKEKLALPASEDFADESLSPLAAWLEQKLGMRLEVVFTRNRSTMLSLKEREGRLHLRLHEVFREAGEPVREALCALVLGRASRETKRVLGEFVQAALPARAPVVARRRSAVGRFHDLKEILDELNRTYFHEAVKVAICWGCSSTKRYRRTIQLGVYVRDQRLIRVHPSLDQAFVPRHYVAWIVFHEMLHDVFGIEGKKRRKVHPAEFMAVEQSYPDYAACKAWETQNLHRLLRFRAR